MRVRVPPPEISGRKYLSGYKYGERVTNRVVGTPRPPAIAAIAAISYRVLSLTYIQRRLGVNAGQALVRVAD